MAGEVAFEAADGFAAGLALAGAPLDVGGCWRVDRAADHDDRVEGAVELAVAAAVEAVADRLAGLGWDRCAAGEPREGRFGWEAALV